MSKIRHRDQIQQIKDFSGLEWGSIYPTDIDGYFEIGNNIFVFIELKYGGKELKAGQKLAFERLVDNFTELKKQAIFIIARHDEEPENDIDVANCQVMKYRKEEKWIDLKYKTTLKDFLDGFIEVAKIKVKDK